MRRSAGDCRLRSRRKGKVRLTGVGAELGVFVGRSAVNGLVTFDEREYGVDSVRIDLPPHLAHLGFSIAEPGVSEEMLLRRPLRFG
jgi:hypothetical protein